MIAIDTSALVAILLEEADAGVHAAAIAAAGVVLLGAPTLLECHLVTKSQLAPAMQAKLLRFYSTPPFVVVPFDEAHLSAAADAFDRFGKGRHPASLNYGDCMAYAVAAVAGCALLYKGGDFALTDIASALA